MWELHLKNQHNKEYIIKFLKKGENCKLFRISFNYSAFRASILDGWRQ